MAEAVLVREELAQEQEPFDTYIQHYRTPLLHYLERLLRDRIKAEDFVQETFLKLYDQLQHRKWPENIPAWLYHVATNLCRDYWRSAGYRREKGSLESLPEQRDRKARVVDLYVRRETRSEILELLKKLPDSHREIIMMRFYYDLKLREIAAAIDCPIGTVKSRLFHALRSLRREMEENGSFIYE
ncbi:RNA polymerase sigma-70 factor (ECF subfamily) [Pullulanibacillus pueri]|uniref:RNA polymerase sigma factor n=1 Tax=Pullulanibacillus pueri TaxID=1437324 RepID=A0A8J2ZWR0_9BACL|nr:RNA polymerase sigma factor [Pullulanibacillus pueri]MBM7682567.1 RNA polymerase sigma-70 factor (ECF subfamily) [Pullulanibacillus pueri]GGH82329.1 RNA polymerase sigma factor [Pullulanibacillus pueri]